MRKLKKAKKPKGATLFDFPPAVHTSDTSIEAAERIMPLVGNLREEIYKVIEEIGPATDEQIAQYAQMNPSTQRPRRLELQREGRIVPAGYGTTRSGRKAQLWAVA